MSHRNAWLSGLGRRAAAAAPVRNLQVERDGRWLCVVDIWNAAPDAVAAGS